MNVVSSKDVNRKIRQVVWPLLKKHGFTTIRGRNAWRHSTDTCEVVNFQSFNSCLASGLGCTTFSFAVNLGVWYESEREPGWPCPRPTWFPPPNVPEPSCQARFALHKSLVQPEFPRSNIWYVRADGGNLGEAIDDAALAIQDKGLPWLQTWRRPEHAMADFLGQLGRGSVVAAPGSFAAALSGGAIAGRLGRWDAALQLWNAVLNNDRYRDFPNYRNPAEQAVAWLRENHPESV